MISQKIIKKFKNLIFLAHPIHHPKDILQNKEEALLPKDILQNKEEALLPKVTPLRDREVEGPIVVEELRMREEILPVEETVRKGFLIQGGLLRQFLVEEDLLEKEKAQEEDPLMLATTLTETVHAEHLVEMNIDQEPILEVGKERRTVVGDHLTQGIAQGGQHPGQRQEMIFMEDQHLTPRANTVDMARRNASPRRSRDQRALLQKT